MFERRAGWYCPIDPHDLFMGNPRGSLSRDGYSVWWMQDARCPLCGEVARIVFPVSLGTEDEPWLLERLDEMADAKFTAVWREHEAVARHRAA